MDYAIQNRVNRDMSEGVLAIRSSGEIMYINATAQKLLGVSDVGTGGKFMDLFPEGLLEQNDRFVQSVLDAVSDKNEKHNCVTDYLDRAGEKHSFSVTSSFLFDEEARAREGVVLCFSDVTETVRNERKAKESSVLLVLLISTVCLWAVFYSALVWFGVEADDFLITQMVNVVSLLACIGVLKFTSLTVADIGLSMKLDRKALRVDALLTLAALLALIVYKFVSGRASPFWHFELLNISDVFYPATVVFQEVLSRCIIHESIYRTLNVRHGSFLAIFTSSLIFAILHIHKGFPYMLGAMLLMMVFGWIYDRQRSIWGLCIPHYVLGTALIVLLGIA